MKKAEEKEKKILVWDGIFKGYQYITKGEVEDRNKFQKEMTMKVLKWGGIALLVFLLLMIILYSYVW